jgi:hypothetical protein
MESPSLQIIICRRGAEWMIVVNKVAFYFEMVTRDGMSNKLSNITVE